MVKKTRDIMKSKCNIALSFDDGRKDNYQNVKDILLQNDLTATFNITTAYIEKSISKDNTPCENEPMSVNEVVELSELGFEIAAHGHNHLNTIEDIKQGVGILKGWLNLNDTDKIGFASPCSQADANQILQSQAEYDEMSIDYVRLGVRNSDTLATKIKRKIAYYTGSKSLFIDVFKDSLLIEEDKYILYSIPILHNTSVAQVKAIIEHSVNANQDCILMLHSIVDTDSAYYNDTWSWDVNRFRQLCGFLHELKENNVVNIVDVKSLISDKRRMYEHE